MPQYVPKSEDIFLTLDHVALIISSDMSTPRHTGLSVSEKYAIGCVTVSLYMFLNIIFSG